jgi:hypothetical protein
MYMSWGRGTCSDGCCRGGLFSPDWGVLDIGISTERSGKETETKYWNMQWQKKCSKCVRIAGFKIKHAKGERIHFYWEGRIRWVKSTLDRPRATTRNLPYEVLFVCSHVFIFSCPTIICTFWTVSARSLGTPAFMDVFCLHIQLKVHICDHLASSLLSGQWVTVLGNWWLAVPRALLAISERIGHVQRILCLSVPSVFKRAGMFDFVKVAEDGIICKDVGIHCSFCSCSFVSFVDVLERYFPVTCRFQYVLLWFPFHFFRCLCFHVLLGTNYVFS